VDDTNPAPASGDATEGSQENDAAYRGLQKVLSKRDADLATALNAYEALKAEHEAATTELTTFRERDAQANEEEQARQTYEQLRQRFDSPPPVPAGNNPAVIGATWADSGGKYAERERTGTGTGWPT
jgi:hypothetical protein